MFPSCKLEADAWQGPDYADDEADNPDTDLRPEQAITLKASKRGTGTFTVKADHSGTVIMLQGGNVRLHTPSQNKISGRKIKGYKYVD